MTKLAAMIANYRPCSLKDMKPGDSLYVQRRIDSRGEFHTTLYCTFVGFYRGMVRVKVLGWHDPDWMRHELDLRRSAKIGEDDMVNAKAKACCLYGKVPGSRVAWNQYLWFKDLTTPI